MSKLISEAITPNSGTFDTVRMARGEPGLPTGFAWRGQSLEVGEVIQAWKESSHEGGHAQGELYLRRHYYQIRMSDDSTWTVYFIRQTPKSGNPKNRWFLYTID